MSYGRHLQAYRANQVMTADPGTILLLLYQGAIDFLQQARAGLEKKDMAEKGQNINRALAIISELLASLNFEIGGEVARNLESLYLFLIDHITNANLRNDAKLLEDAVSMLLTLKEGWEGAVASERKRLAQQTAGQIAVGHQPMPTQHHESSLAARA